MQLSIVIEPTSAEFYFRMFWALGRPNLSQKSILEQDPSSVQAPTPIISGEPLLVICQWPVSRPWLKKKIGNRPLIKDEVPLKTKSDSGGLTV